MHRRLTTFAMKVVALAMLAAHDSAAITLDWNAPGITFPNPGEPNRFESSYDVDGNAANGADIHVEFTGTLGEMIDDTVSGVATPTLNTNLQGGMAAGNRSLNMALDLGKQDRFIIVTITFLPGSFTQGVEGISFSLFDIDQALGSNAYIDQVRSIFATTTTGTSVAPTITNVGSALSHTGLGLSQTLTGTAAAPDQGAGSNAGNATISFHTPGIRTLSFVYGAPNHASNNPAAQDISLGSINFSPVPEANPVIVAAAICGLAGALVISQRKKTRLA